MQRPRASHSVIDRLRRRRLLLITTQYHRAGRAIQPVGRRSWLRGFEAKAAIERGRDVHHVDALEELLPGRRGAERHSTGRVLPDRHDDPGYVGGGGASLKRLLYFCLLGWAGLSERAIDRDDDHVLTITSQVRPLKSGHRN